MDPQLSVVSNPDLAAMDIDDDQAQDLSMTSLRTSQSECDLRDLRNSSDTELSPIMSSVIQQPAL